MRCRVQANGRRLWWMAIQRTCERVSRGTTHEALLSEGFPSPNPFHLPTNVWVGDLVNYGIPQSPFLQHPLHSRWAQLLCGNSQCSSFGSHSDDRQCSYLVGTAYHMHSLWLNRWYLVRGQTALHVESTDLPSVLWNIHWCPQADAHSPQSIFHIDRSHAHYTVRPKTSCRFGFRTTRLGNAQPLPF